jgi:hypothetical protein
VPALDSEKSLAPFAHSLPPGLSRVPAFRPDETTLAAIPFYTDRRVVPFELLEDALYAAQTRPAWIVIVVKHDRDAVPDVLKTAYPYIWLNPWDSGYRMLLLSNVEK